MRSLLAITAAAFIHLQAHALPASQESVEALLTITKTESMMDSMYGGVEQAMRQGMKESLQGKPVSAEQQRMLDAVPPKFMAVMRQEFNWSKMKPLYVQLYRETFEQEEIDGLVAFYKSSAGQAFVNKMPVVMQKSITIAQSQMQALMPKIKEAIDSAIAEAKLVK
jgi:uncharacterized protein